MKSLFHFLTLILLLLPLSAGAAMQGKIADGKYYSAGGWFNVPIPKSSNSAQVPFSIEDKIITNISQASNVIFSVKEFGEILIAGVEHISDDLKNYFRMIDDLTLLSNFANMVFPYREMGFNQDFPTRPKIVEETYLDTPYGKAFSPIFLAEKGSLLVPATGPAPTAADTLIAVIVVKQKDRIIYAIAENDAEGGGTDRNKEALKQRGRSFFTSIAVRD